MAQLAYFVDVDCRDAVQTPQATYQESVSPLFHGVEEFDSSPSPSLVVKQENHLIKL